VNADIPTNIQVYFVDEFDAHASPTGARGIGELGATGVAAAVASAVYDAVGIRIRDLPITPARVVVGLTDVNTQWNEVVLNQLALTFGSDGLEQFNQIAGRIFQKDLPPTVAGNDVSAKGCSGFAKLSGQGVKIVCLDLKPVPAPRLRCSSRLASAARPRRIQHKTKIPARQHGKPRGRMHVDGKAEPVTIESDALADI
jgi:hypothetical protein